MRRFVTFIVLISSIVFSKTIHVIADYAVPTEDTVEYSGNVHAIIEEENVELWADYMRITKMKGDWNLIEASGTVFVKLEDMEATTSKLRYDMSTKKGSMSEDVEIYRQKDETSIWADFVEFDREADLYEGSSTKLSRIVRKDVTLEGKYFRYDGKNSRLHIKGNFKALKVKEEGEKEEMKVYGDEADIDTENDNMVVKGNVRIEYGQIEASCEEMEFDMKAKGKLKKNVKTLIRGEKEDEKDIEIESDRLDFDTDREVYKGYSYGDRLVKIIRGDTTVRARWFEYFRKEGKVYLHENVTIDSKDKNVIIHAEQAIIYTEEEKMELWKVRMEIKR